MPNALLEYDKGWDAWSGTIPTNRKDMWTIFYNYYLNDIQDVDRRIQSIVDVLNEMDLWRTLSSLPTTAKWEAPTVA